MAYFIRDIRNVDRGQLGVNLEENGTMILIIQPVEMIVKSHVRVILLKVETKSS